MSALRLAAAMAVLALATAAPALARGSRDLRAHADAAQLVPPAFGAATAARARFAATVVDEPVGASLRWRIALAGVRGKVRVEIHLGRRGELGPPTMVLCVRCGRHASGTAFVPPQILAALVAGRTYLSVVAAGGDEALARGQIVEARA